MQKPLPCGNSIFNLLSTGSRRLIYYLLNSIKQLHTETISILHSEFLVSFFFEPEACKILFSDESQIYILCKLLFVSHDKSLHFKYNFIYPFSSK